MIAVTFFKSEDVLSGFRVSGHSDYSEQGSDIVCAAVSSAVYLAANTITDVQRINAEVTERDGFMSLKLPHNEAKNAYVVLAGLELHLTALSEQYNKYIKVKISEV